MATQLYAELEHMSSEDAERSPPPAMAVLMFAARIKELEFIEFTHAEIHSE